MKRFLAAIDFSDVTPAVVDVAAKLAEAFQGDLCILHTAPPEPDFVGYQVGPQYVRDAVAREIKSAAHQLQVIADDLAARGIEAKTLQLQGPTVQKILQEAERFEADLIVVGHHEHGEFHDILFGCVETDLIHDGDFPVLVVPAAGKED